jgi:hypothetical protein
MKGKKGVEVQLNWILVLIAGALILLFFIGVVVKQKEISQIKLGGELTTQLDTIFTGQLMTPGKINKIDTAQVPITFGCTDYTINSVPRGTANTALFSPKEIKAKQLILWTQSAFAPFLITNFLYVTSEQYSYYFINFNAQDIEKLKEILPESINPIFLPAGAVDTIMYKNEPGIKLVFYNTPARMPDKLRYIEDYKVYAVELEGADSFDTMLGSLIFHRKEESFVQEGVFPMLGEESFFGAVFAENADAYACQMRKVTQRYYHMARIYQARARELANTARTAGGECENFLTNADFSNLLEVTQDSLIQPEEVPELRSNIQSLKIANQQVVYASCPPLY